MKTMPWRRSLAARLIVLQGAIGLAVAVGSLVAVYFDATARLDRQLETFAAQLGARLSPGLDERQADEVARNYEGEHTKALSSAFNVRYRPQLMYQVYAPDRRLLARSEQAPLTPLVPMAPQRRIPAGGGSMPAFVPRVGEVSALANDPSSSTLPPSVESFSDVNDLTYDGERWRVARAVSGLGYETQAAESRVWRRDAVLATMRPYFARIAWVLPLVLLVTVLVARYTLEPLRQLARTLAARTPGSLAGVQSPRDYAELVPLSGEINQLLAQLRRLLASERESFADAAHELLTPIAVIQAQAHLLATAEDGGARASARSDLEQSLMRASSLIRQLLLLTRVGADASSVMRVEGDLVRPVREHVAQAATRARVRDIEVTLDTPAECRVRFDRDTLMSALDNLLDNALRYTPPTGHVVVKLWQTANAISLSVADDGPGIPPNYRERVVQRFFRVPGTLESGSGLGLAIVDCVVRLHGGSLRLDHGINGRGLTATMVVPSR